jgi:hypothetical protein
MVTATLNRIHMKMLKIYFCLFATLSVLMLGCKEDEELNFTTTITDVNLTSFPIDNTLIVLNPGGPDSLKIYWDRSKAANGTMVLYSVQFDKENGDFSSPLANVLSDSSGISRKARMHHKIVNAIAEDAGIAPLGKGTLKWRTVASNGVSFSYSASHTVEVERPTGIADTPLKVFITGTATEGGEKGVNAIEFKPMVEIVGGVNQKLGEFEIYTSLGSGTYRFASSNTVGPARYYSVEGTTLKKNGESNSPTSIPKVYHIYLNFKTATATLTEVTSVGLFYGESNGVFSDLVYKGKGVWVGTDAKPYVTGSDNRYKFAMTKKPAGGTLTNVFWGHATQSSSTVPTVTGMVATYYLVNERSDFNQYDYSFRFPAAAVDRPLTVSLSLTAVSYTHSVTIN